MTMAIFEMDATSILDLAKRLDDTKARAVAGEVFGIVTEAAAKAKAQGLACMERSWPNAKQRRWEVSFDVTPSGGNVVGIVRFKHPWIRFIAGGEDMPHHIIRKEGRMRIGHAKAGGEVELDKRGRPIIRTGPFLHPGYKGKDCVTPAYRTGAAIMERKLKMALRRLARAAGGRN